MIVCALYMSLSDCALRNLVEKHTIISMESELISEYLHFYMQRGKQHALNLHSRASSSD